MDTAKLWLMLLCVCGSWILSLAIQCDKTTQYEHENRCPSGHYPKELCKSECVDCSTAKSPRDKCFCKDKHVCNNDECESCYPRVKCKPGQQLKRNGAFDYSYICEACPDNNYNDAEDSTCKPITKCDSGAIFPGNKTHNARCGSANFTTVHPRDQEGQNNGSQTTHSFMVACLAFTVLTCLLFIMYAAFKICTYKMKTKINKPLCTHRMALPSDTRSCKLSKEEEGEENDTKTALSQFI